jgi:NitT/TauT family transport system substrate-binding protein
MRKNTLARAIIIAAAAIVIVGLVLWVAGNSSQAYSAKIETIAVAYAPFESTALFWIAEDQHFFKRNGLNINLHKYDAGVQALDGMLNDEAEIAIGIAEFPFVGKVFREKNIRIIGNIDKAELIYIVGRKDRGIEKPADLKGKKVGTTFRTVAEFYLGTFLNLHGMNMMDITLVDVKTPGEWVNAVVNGEIDAISTAQPYVRIIKERLGDNAFCWPAQSNQVLFGLIITTDKWIHMHPELVKRLLKSLAQAEEHLIRHPADLNVIVQKRLDLDPAYMETVRTQNYFSLSLDQSLIVMMEDQARWMIKNQMTETEEVPNFLDYIHFSDLEQLKPEAVTIIH